MEDLVAIIAVTLIFGGIPITIFGIMGINRMNLKLKMKEREQMLAAYREIVKDKLDVIKTALSMGAGQDEIGELDRRLERLIGGEQMKTLLDPKRPQVPEPTTELLDTDLTSEVTVQRAKQLEEND